jgi:hypothetical protein
MTVLLNPFMTGNLGGPGIIPSFGDDVWLGIEHKTAPVADVFDFTGHDLTGCQRLMLVLSDVTVDTDDADVLLEIYCGGYLFTNHYSYNNRSFSSSGTTPAEESDAAVAITFNDLSAAAGIGNAAGERLSALAFISGINAAVHKLVCFDCEHVRPDGSMARVAGGGALLQTEPVTGLKVRGNGGTIASGHATLYGLANDDPAVVESLWVGAPT